MHRTCTNPWCRQTFEVTDQDLGFYDKVSPVIGGKKLAIPPPSLCYDCRQQRRQAMRNEHFLYKRNCDLCKKHIISVYAPDSEITAYCPTCFWSDKWDPLSYGRDFDFRRSFFEQFGELWTAIPKLAVIVLPDNINSDYAHDALRLKNCYLIFDGDQAQDSYYGEVFVSIRNCCDFFSLIQCELCYECIHCAGCFNLVYSRFCQNCSDSAFLLDCVSCRNCIGCVNLAQKEYHIFNQLFTKDEFERKKAGLLLHTHSGVSALKRQAEDFFLKHPRKAFRGTMNEETIGDNVSECKNVRYSFDCLGLRDCNYCTNIAMGGVDCQDIDAWGNNLTLAYNSSYVGENAERLIAGYYLGMGVSNLCYSMFCLQGAKDSFGCIALKKMRHCILNKQYSKEEYESLVPKIVDHMRATGEWGEFFPPQLSMFGYNETVAQDYYPLSKDEVLKRGWKWREQKDEMPNVSRVIDAAQLPDSIDDIPDDILNWAIKCEQTGKPFRLQKSELELYRRMRVPVPRCYFDVRHRRRLALRNPRKLWDRECMKCDAAIRTSYAPERPEKVFCEGCYLQEVY